MPRGGPREGAGRKPSKAPHKILVTFRMSPKVLALVEDECQASGRKKIEVIETAITDYFDRSKQDGQCP